MLWLAIIDMGALYCNSLSFGAVLLTGTVYCAAPLYIFCAGALAIG